MIGKIRGFAINVETFILNPSSNIVAEADTKVFKTVSIVEVNYFVTIRKVIYPLPAWLFLLNVQISLLVYRRTAF
jgi:hypothetical protein